MLVLYSYCIIPAIIITVLAAVFRFTGLAWDTGWGLHPDEALIIQGASGISFFSNLFPGFHDYNGLSVYVLALSARLVSVITGSVFWIRDPEGLTLVGRFLSALLSTLSVPLIMALAVRLRDTRTGLVAGLLFTATPLSIQLAHFYTTEGMLLLLYIVLLHICLSFTKSPKLSNLFLLSSVMGFLLATKNTAFLLLPIPLYVLVRTRPTLRCISVFVLCTVSAFFLASPYSFLDAGGYISRFRYLSDVVNGRLLMDWTLQFQETTPLFWVPNLLFAFGPALAAGIIGAAWQIRRMQKKSVCMLVLSLWFISFLLFLGYTYLKFIRYSALSIPLTALFAALLYVRMYAHRTGKIIVTMLCVIQLVWAGMFCQIYTKPHTSVLAAKWIAQHVPPKTMILREKWNSIIRFDRPPLADKQHTLNIMNFYSSETDEKILSITQAIKNADIVIIESPKVKNTVFRLIVRYPKTAQLYKKLEDGSLGLTKVQEFSSYPSFGPFQIRDDWLEETWYAFDHPTVTLYAKKDIVVY